ncbi:MAG: sulfotransferase domain-containing protein [Spirosomataceae bacterium]
MAKYDLIWLASYPKSGNTWLRCFFSALLFKEKLDLNNLEFNEVFANKGLFSLLVKKNITDFDEQQLERERRKVLDFYLKTKPSPYLLKIHDKYTISSYDNLPIFHTNRPKAAIYIVRNPFDVALSFSRYLGVTIDEIIDRYVCKTGATIYMNQRFPRQIGTWQEHLMSWKEQTEIPVIFVRYEDLKINPYQNFKKILSFLELDFSEDKIQDAIRKSDFNTLKCIESIGGFRERLLENVPFFHSAEIDRGAKKLSSTQQKKILHQNQDAMKSFGYL